MATRDSTKKPFLTTSHLFLILLSFLLLLSLFLISPFDRAPLPILGHDRESPTRDCDYSGGVWIRDAEGMSMRYDSTCSEIFKGWNCIRGGKSNARELIRWRWQPRGCDLPRFDPLEFLRRYRDKNIGFVGDSLNRNMFVCLVCALKRVGGAVKKWRPHGADRGFTFLEYNVTVAYHRTNLLVQYDGLQAQLAVLWNLLVTNKDTRSMLISLQLHGRRLLAFTTSLF